MTVALCAATCAQSNSKYAGMEYAGECCTYSLAIYCPKIILTKAKIAAIPFWAEMDPRQMASQAVTCSAAATRLNSVGVRIGWICTKLPVPAHNRLARVPPRRCLLQWYLRARRRHLQRPLRQQPLRQQPLRQQPLRQRRRPPHPVLPRPPRCLLPAPLPQADFLRDGPIKVATSTTLMDVSFPCSCLTIQVLLWNSAFKVVMDKATLLQAWNTVRSAFAVTLSTAEVLSHPRTPTATCLAVAMRRRLVALVTG